MSDDTTTTTERRTKITTAMRQHESNTQLAVILTLVLVGASEEEERDVRSKFQDAYDALFGVIDGRPTDSAGTRPTADQSGAMSANLTPQQRIHEEFRRKLDHLTKHGGKTEVYEVVGGPDVVRKIGRTH